MKHIVSLSGGVSSAMACDRVVQRYGRENVIIWFADTLWEDMDLYRFLDDCMIRWGGEMIRHIDGRNPLQVAEEKLIIPNGFRAPCSLELKIRPFRRFLRKQKKPLTIHFGLDWTEMHRFAAPKKNYESIKGVTVDFPLMWEPLETKNYFDTIENDWGIKTPQLYKYGFSHNNCGGRCVKQGIKEWNRLRVTHPDRFAEVRD